MQYFKEKISISDSNAVKHLLYISEYRNMDYLKLITGNWEHPGGRAAAPPSPGPAQTPEVDGLVPSLQPSSQLPPHPGKHWCSAPAAAPCSCYSRPFFFPRRAKIRWCPVVGPVEKHSTAWWDLLKLMCSGENKMETSIYSLAKEDFNLTSHYDLKENKKAVWLGYIVSAFRQGNTAEEMACQYSFWWYFLQIVFFLGKMFSTQ